MPSAFDADTFLGTQHNQALDTTVIPVPEGEYTAVVDNLNARQVSNQETGEISTVVDITWSIDDEDGSVRKVTRREKNTVRQGIFLELTPEGVIDASPGANVSLGRLREALGQNEPGKPWSFEQLRGQAARIVVTHTKSKKSDDIYANVNRVSAL